MFAASAGDDICVKALVRVGADVNLRNDDGQTALTIAALWDDDKCVDVLAEAESIPKDLSLQHLCRNVIRKNLLQMSNLNLFVMVPKLGLPHLSEFLLFSEILDEDDED